MIIKNFGVYALAFLLLAAPAFACAEKASESPLSSIPTFILTGKNSAACYEFESQMRADLKWDSDHLKSRRDDFKKWQGQPQPHDGKIEEILDEQHNLLALSIAGYAVQDRHDKVRMLSWLCSIVERLEKIETQR